VIDTIDRKDDRLRPSHGRGKQSLAVIAAVAIGQTMMQTPALDACLGAIVGVILALTGAGGGILAVPLLIFALDLSMKQAAPVGLVAVGLSAAVGAALGLREGTVRYRAAALMGVAGIALAPFGVWLGQRVPNPPLLIGFAFVLGSVAWRMFWLSRHPSAAGGARNPARHPSCVVDPATGRLRWTLPCTRTLATTGMLSACSPAFSAWAGDL